MSRTPEHLSEPKLLLLLEAVLQEFRYAARSLRRSPGFTATAILILALATGVNSALFSVVYNALWRPLPYRDAERLVVIEGERQYRDAPKPLPAAFRLADLDDWRARLNTFDSLAFFTSDSYVLSSATGSEVVNAALVSDEFFSTVGGQFASGRPLDRTATNTPSVVISQPLAQRLFDQSQHAVGATLVLNATAYTVVGVASDSFVVPSSATDVWMSAAYEQGLHPREGGFRPIGRLKPHVTIDQADLDLRASAQTLHLTHPQSFEEGLRLKGVTLRDHVLGNLRPALIVLWCAVGLIMIVSCANLANLLLVRNVALMHDRAVCVALGVSSSRLFLRALIDSGILATLGSMVGLTFAAGLIAGLPRLTPAAIPLVANATINAPVLLFAIGVSLLAAVAIGVLPAFDWARPVWQLTTSARTTSASRRLRHGLCVAELAVATVLLVGAALLGRSLVQLLHTDIGVVADNVSAASVNLAFQQRRSDAQVVQLADRVVTRIRQSPGVRTVGLGTSLPPNAGGFVLTLKRKGDTVDYAATAVTVTPGYFEALGVRLLKGRLFNDTDDAAHAPVIIMSDTTARRFFGDGDPIGRTLNLPTLRDGVMGNQEMRLVGVIADVKYSGLAAAADDQVYRPFAQQVFPNAFVVIRADTESAAASATIRRQIASVDPTIVVVSIRTLGSVLFDETASPRFRTVLLASLASLGLAIATIGLYGVVSYSVTQRNREIAVRIALGAQPRDVSRMMLMEGMRIAAMGAALGVAVAFGAARWLSAMLFGVKATDLTSFLVSTAVVIAVTLAATYIPARRAARVHPSEALNTQ